LCRLISAFEILGSSVREKQVVVNGAASDVGKAAIVAIHKARGMEVAGAVDTKFEGKDAGEVLHFCFQFSVLSW
jgi:NADPH:quinone reductase-like Zn-dependent oxidoreductase